MLDRVLVTPSNHAGFAALLSRLLAVVSPCDSQVLSQNGLTHPEFRLLNIAHSFLHRSTIFLVIEFLLCRRFSLVTLISKYSSVTNP